MTLDAVAVDGAITTAAPLALDWVASDDERSATATIVVPVDTAERARMRLALDLASGSATTTHFTFAVRGTGERVYVPANALLHAVGRARFDASDLLLPTTTPGVQLAVRAIGTEIGHGNCIKLSWFIVSSYALIAFVYLMVAFAMMSMPKKMRNEVFKEAAARARHRSIF